MQENKLVRLLNKVIGSTGQKLTKQDEYVWFCPQHTHHKPKLQINLKTHKWHCWICGIAGRTLFQLLKTIGAQSDSYTDLSAIIGTKYQYREESTEIEVATLPREFKALYGNTVGGVLFNQAYSYLKKRGIDDSDILRYNIGYCTDGLYANRIIIPSYDSQHRLNYFISRSFQPNATYKYKNPPVSKDVIGFDILINWDHDEITLAEGVFDVMAIKRNAVPLYGKCILGKLKKKLIASNISRINICLDNDARKDALDIAEYLLNNGKIPYMVELPVDKDPSDIGFVGMTKLIRNSKPVRIIDIISSRLSTENKKFIDIF